MQTRVVYLKGDMSDEATLMGLPGFKLQSVVQVQGQIVGYMVREPWLDGEAKPLVNRSGLAQTASLEFVPTVADTLNEALNKPDPIKAAAQAVVNNKHKRR